MIDPVLIVSTYLGGDYIDGGFDVALDKGGNIYVTGLTRSADFPVSEGAVRSPRGPSFDVFVAKLNPVRDGSRVWRCHRRPGHRPGIGHHGG